MAMTINGSRKKADGFKPMNKIIADEEKINIRQSICRDCDSLIKPMWTCKECGCFMKIKTRLNISTCPLGKW